MLTWQHGCVCQTERERGSAQEREIDRATDRTLAQAERLVGTVWMWIVMGSWRRWWFLSLSLLSSVLLVCSYGRVFRRPADASTVFLRSKRANAFFLEEMLQGNLERECYEETCNYEEAREYFENTPKTDTFWNVYVDGDQCKPNPCLHGGSCKDGVGGYTCNCTELYQGENCEIGQQNTYPRTLSDYLSQCPTKAPFSCDHFCSPRFGEYQCSCTTGYKIHSDKKSCIPAVKYPCGRLQPTNQIKVAYHVCPHNRCPWQVVFVDEAGTELCSGVILGPHTVLTSASCVYMGKKLHSMQTGASNNSVRISLSTQLYIHNRHKRGSLEDDLALVRLNEPLPFGPSVSHLCLPTKDFSENILMSPGREGVARGPDKLRGESHGPPVLSYLHVEGCRNQVKLSQPLTNKMFCMGSQKGFCGTELTTFNETDLKPGQTRNSSLLSGTPVVTVERRTAFLTGLLLSPPTSHGCGQTLVFTKLSRYLNWIQQRLEMAEVKMTPQMTQDPPGPYGVTPTLT